MDLLISSPLAALSVAAPPPEAEPDTPPAPREIVVTGERAPRTIRETQSSVVALEASEIEATGADRLDQLLALLPNVQMGSGEEGPAIRGQDSTGVLRNLFAFLGGTRPRTTVQVDGRPISYYEYVNSSAPLWEVERVEVFRSPQTTTQGRNSIAGAIFVETADPSYEWAGRARVIAGSFDTRQASVALSAPIVRDQLALGLSGDVRFSRMASDLADGIPGADIERDDYGTARAKLLFEPAAAPELRIEATYAHTLSQAPQFEAVQAPFRERRFTTAERTNGVHRINVDSLTLRGEHRHTAQLTSRSTVSFGDAVIRRFGLPGLGLTRVLSRDYSAEGNLQWVSDGVELLGGLHHLRTRQRQTIDITGLGIGSGEFVDRQESTGVFGEARWRPVPRLLLTAGARYQHDSQRREGQVGTPPGGIRLAYNGRFDAWLPKFSIAYDVALTATVGLMAQRAYNPGGTSVSLARRVGDEFGAETLWNYEAFARASLADGRASFSTNLFFNHIRNAQRQQLVAVPTLAGGTFFATEFANAPRARTSGAEAELAWRASPRLSLRGGLGLLRTRVSETVLATDPTLGKDFQRSPKLSLSGAIDWNPLPPLRLSAQARHHSAYFSDDANTLARRIVAGTTVDIRGSYTLGRFTLFGYARNAFDAFSLDYLFTPTFGTAEDPRDVGIGLEASF